MSDKPTEGMQALYKSAILTMIKEWPEEKREAFKPKLKGKSLRDQMKEVARENMKDWKDPDCLQGRPGARLEDI